MKSLSVLAAFLLFAPSSFALTRQWTNTLGGNWFTAANWSPNSVPGPLDTAVITNSGTYSVNILTGAVAVADLRLGGSSGTQTLLNGTTANLAVTNSGIVGPNGVLSITNGGLQGNLLIQASGLLDLSGGAAKNVYQLNLVNQGTVNWSGGTLQGGSTPTTVVSNGGLWQATSDNTFYNYWGNTMFWTNSGTFVKSAGVGTTTLQGFSLVNQPGGVISALSGIVSLNGNASSVLGGTLSATIPGLVSIIGGTWTDAGGVTAGSGTNQFAGGILQLRTNLVTGLRLVGGEVYVTGTTTFQQAGAITNLTLEGSQLRGTNRVGNGALTVNAGGMDGQLTVQPGGLLQLTNAAAKNVYQLNLVNQGTVNWSGGTLQGGSTPTTVVSNGGLWQATSDNTFYNYWGNTMFWTNSGTFVKSASVGTTTLQGFSLVNQPGGVISALSGIVSLNGNASSVLGGTLSATIPGLVSIIGGTWTDAGGVTAGSGTNQFAGGILQLRTNLVTGLRLVGGEVYITGTTTFQQAGAITNLTLDGSQLRGTNRIGNGVLTVNTGGADGQLTVQPGGQLLFASGAAKNVYQLFLVNQGTVNWTGGTLQGGSNPTTVVSNGGLWQATSDNTFYNYWGNTMFWTNSGTFVKSASVGTTTLQGFSLVNLPGGVISALSGIVSLNGNASSVLGGTLSATSPGLVSIIGGTWTDAGGGTSGTGTNQFAGGVLQLRTNLVTGLKLVGGEVYVTGTNTFQQAGAITNLTLDGSQLRGTNLVGNGVLTVNTGGVDGQLTVQPGGQLLFASGAAKNVYQLFLVNQGTVNWTGGTLQGGSNPTTVVSNGGLWQATSDNTFYNYWGNTMFWTNSGTFVKSAGVGTTTLQGFSLVNLPGGVISALSGIVSLNGSASSVLGGTLSATIPGLVSIISGTWTDAGGVTAGTGTNQFAGGVLQLRTNLVTGLKLVGGEVYVTGTNTFQQGGAITNLTLDGSQLRGTNRIGNGVLTVNAGGVDGRLTVQAGGQLLLASSASKNLYQLFLVNQGTVNWTGGTLQGGSNPTTVVSNGGLWQASGDNTFYNYWGNMMIWTNAGTFAKSSGVGTTSLQGCNLENLTNGLIRTDAGTLQLPTGFTNRLGVLRLNGGTLSAGGILAMVGGSLEGAGTLGANALTGGTVTPGQGSAGLMQFNSGLTLGSGATLSLAGTGIVPGTQYDQLSVTGAVALSNCTLQVTSLPSVSAGTTFTIILNDGADAVGGTFNGLPENALFSVGPQTFRIHYFGGTGNDVTLVRDGAPPLAVLTTGGLTNGVWRFSGSGVPSTVYTIQASTNLVQWTNIGLATGDVNGKFSVSDSNAFQFRYRFYRTTN